MAAIPTKDRKGDQAQGEVGMKSGKTPMGAHHDGCCPSKQIPNLTKVNDSYCLGKKAFRNGCFPTQRRREKLKGEESRQDWW